MVFSQLGSARKGKCANKFIYHLEFGSVELTKYREFYGLSNLAWVLLSRMVDNDS